MEKQAIIHVENTQNVIEFADYLTKSGWRVLSANKTEELLKKNKIPVAHEAALEEKNFYVQETSLLIRRVLMTRVDSQIEMNTPDSVESNIYILCLNINPFFDPAQKTPITSRASIRPDNLYISTLLRNSFYNFENLLILTDPSDYKEAMIQLKTDNVSKDFRLYLAAKA